MYNRHLKIFSFLFIVFCIVPVSSSAFNISTLFMGTIQFPYCLETIPDIRVYCGGHKIACEQGKNNQISFAIRGARQRTSFYLLITKTLAYETIEKNTIRYLKLPSQQPYKLYRLTLVLQETPYDETQKQNSPHYVWDVQEQRLAYNRIPDDAIIVCYPPDYIESIKGGNAIELPTIRIKSDIVNLVGSENLLHEKSIELLLSSLDHDALHSTIKQELKHDQKTILAVTVT